MTVDNIWDSPELRPDAAYIKFAAVGDTASGVIQSIRVHRWEDGSVSPKIHLMGEDGEERTLTVGQVKLKVALVEARPEPGDHLFIKLTEVERRAGGKTLKHFDVKVTKPTRTKPPAPVVDRAQTLDQAALMAAMANLTDAQRATLGVTG